MMKNPNHTVSTRWEIKLNYATSAQKNFQVTESAFSLSRNQTSLSLELPSEVDWVIFNIQQTGECVQNCLKTNSVDKWIISVCRLLSCEL